MELIKGFIFDRGAKEYNGKQLHSYLVSFQLVTDKRLTNVGNETVIMRVKHLTQGLTEEIDTMDKYKAPFPLGDALHAIHSVSEMNPNDLEKV